ncbi:MAG TPA: trigger factor [Terriglobales bacterium]|nr:trigger factor [Bryobacteraceae bacterium]HTR26389.1 trigger factor [Terriglobales bacterium]
MLIEGCKHELEIEVPLDEVDRETERVVLNLQKKVRIPGFRPGKAPANIIRTRFAGELRQDVLEGLVPRALNKRLEEEHLEFVGTPNISDVHFEKGEPLRFKAQFEVAPEFELGEYNGVTVHYAEPQVTDADVEERLNQIRESRAEYVNIDPRPAEDGDHAVIALESVAGAAEPVKQDEMMVNVGGADTMPAFTEALRGMTPGEEKQVEVTYPEDYGQEKLAGRTVTFKLHLKVIRRKDLPEVNDEFAKDLGDYQNLDEVRDAIRKSIFHEREHKAQQDAKNELVEKLVEAHVFPVPEAYVERQIEIQLEQQLRDLAGAGVDPRKLNLDWAKLKESRREKATSEVRGSLLLGKIADREHIDVTQDEVDREVQRIARQEREPVAATRKRLEEKGIIRRIVSGIRTEKTLNFLFEHARKEAPVEAPAEQA